MAPKRSRSKGKAIASSSEAHEDWDYDRERFDCEDAEFAYNTLRGRPLLKERGLANEEPFSAYIQEFGWEKFCETPCPAIDEVVYEFYANLKFHSNYKVNVRGRRVNISPDAINKFFGLPSYDPDGYTEYKDFEPDLNEMVGAITSPDEEWILPFNWTLFPRGKLTPSAKVWYYFICARLMPTSHHSEVLKKRAFLTYALQVGLSVNVGEIIHEELFISANGKTSDSLILPNMITALCLKARVEVAETEKTTSPGGLIKLSMYLPREPRRVARPEASTSRPVHQSTSRNAQQQGNPPSIEQRLTRVENELRAFYEYQTAFNDRLAQVLTFNFPNPAVQFPTYQPPPPPEDDQD